MLSIYLGLGLHIFPSGLRISTLPSPESPYFSFRPTKYQKSVPHGTLSLQSISIRTSMPFFRHFSTKLALLSQAHIISESYCSGKTTRATALVLPNSNPQLKLQLWTHRVIIHHLKIIQRDVFQRATRFLMKYQHRVLERRKFRGIHAIRID